MFIDRKINGALIQDLALRGEGMCEDRWRRNREEEDMENEQQRRERIKQMRVNKEE